MTRLCADACTPAYLPGWPDEATYVDGACKSSASTKIRVSSLGTNAGNALDVEPGNPLTGAAVVGWVQSRRAAGEPWVWVYCFVAGTNGVANGSGYTLQDLQTAFRTAGEPPPLWWVAIPAASRQGLSTALPEGASMVQVLYEQGAGYDVSVMADYIPGYDPAPTPPDPPKPKENEMIIVGVTPASTTESAVLILPNGQRFTIESGSDLQALTAAGIPYVAVSQDLYSSLTTA